LKQSSKLIFSIRIFAIDLFSDWIQVSSRAKRGDRILYEIASPPKVVRNDNKSC